MSLVYSKICECALETKGLEQEFAEHSSCFAERMLPFVERVQPVVKRHLSAVVKEVEIRTITTISITKKRNDYEKDCFNTGSPDDSNV